MTRTARRISITLASIAVLIFSFLWKGPSRVQSPQTEPNGPQLGEPPHRDTTPLVRPLIDSPKPAPRTDTARIPSTYTGPTDQLIIPVAGIKATQLVDTYTQARSGGRVHDAIDIIAPHNSPVLAATSGTILRLFQSRLGGTTLYQLGPDQHTVYYYAHLDHYADGLTQGSGVKQGDIIGYVGDTGDAGPGNYHLHFAIWRIEDPKKFWDGQNINPYPILRQAH